MQEDLARLLKILFARLFSEWVDRYIPPALQREIWFYTWRIFVAALIMWVLQAVAREVLKPDNIASFRAATKAWIERAHDAVAPFRVEGPGAYRWPIIGSMLGLLCAAIGTWPYDFYTLLRFGVLVVCLLELFGAGLARRYRIWTWILVGVALLYNPFLPVRLHRETWAALNWATTGLFGVLLALFRPMNAGASPPQSKAEAGLGGPPRGPDGRFLARPPKADK